MWFFILGQKWLVFIAKISFGAKNTFFVVKSILVEKYHLGQKLSFFTKTVFLTKNIFGGLWIKILKNFESKSSFRQNDDFRGYTFEWIWHEFSRNDTYSRIFLNNVILNFLVTQDIQLASQVYFSSKRLTKLVFCVTPYKSARLIVIFVIIQNSPSDLTIKVRLLSGIMTS